MYIHVHQTLFSCLLAFLYLFIASVLCTFPCTCICTVCVKETFPKTLRFVLSNCIYHVVYLLFLTVVLFGFEPVSFHCVALCQVVSTDAKSNCREVKNRKAKLDFWQATNTATRDSKTITIFEASLSRYFTKL